MPGSGACLDMRLRVSSARDGNGGTATPRPARNRAAAMSRAPASVQVTVTAGFPYRREPACDPADLNTGNRHQRLPRSGVRGIDCRAVAELLKVRHLAVPQREHHREIRVEAFVDWRRRRVMPRPTTLSPLATNSFASNREKFTFPATCLKNSATAAFPRRSPDVGTCDSAPYTPFHTTSSAR